MDLNSNLSLKTSVLGKQDHFYIFLTTMKEHTY